jgi:hypothetical protein
VYAFEKCLIYGFIAKKISEKEIKEFIDRLTNKFAGFVIDNHEKEGIKRWRRIGEVV